MTGGASAAAVAPPVSVYKGILRDVLDNRPSGTRQRLAAALGKNRSFVSQIANPAYPVPIPAQHIETIFDLCHFSQQERKSFMAAYGKAHPARLKLVRNRTQARKVTLTVPDLGDPARNHAVDALLDEFAAKVARIVEDLP